MEKVCTRTRISTCTNVGSQGTLLGVTPQEHSLSNFKTEIPSCLELISLSLLTQPNDLPVSASPVLGLPCVLPFLFTN